MAQAVSRTRLSAFSLFEFLLVLALIAIFSCVAVISFLPTSSYRQMQGFKRQVESALRFARSEAILRGVNVVFCGSRDQRHCDGHWSQGLLVRTAEGERLQVYSGMAKRFTLTFVANFARNDRVVFTSQGFTAGQQGHFEICDLNYGQCSILRLQYSGQVVDGGV